MEKRTLTYDEVKLMVRLGDCEGENNGLMEDRHFHIMRETVNGNKIGCCDIAKNCLDNKEGYFSYKYTPFLAICLGNSLCDFCAGILEDEGLL